jgi:molybdopterin-binding protein
MPHFRISSAAELLGVSDDTVRRWISTGRLESSRDASGRQVIDGERLAAFASEQTQQETGSVSARNQLDGIVTRVVVDGVMAQVEIAAGRFRIVSLMSREAVEELDLRPGVLATAVVKATTVIIQTKDAHA